VREALDTVQDWPPEPARVMTVRSASLRTAAPRLPGYMVLAQVPLSRFVRVPTRHSYTEWLQRVGSLSADLLVCDTGSRVLAVIDMRARRKASAAAAATNAGAGAAGRRRARARLARRPPAHATEVRTALAHDLLAAPAGYASPWSRGRCR
jgi:hypothetical protein